MKVLENEAAQAVFIVGNDFEVTSKSACYVYSIPQDVFESVEAFVSTFRPRLDYLVNNGTKGGTVYYWEENYHDKIVAFLMLMIPNGTVKNISNSLCALGF